MGVPIFIIIIRQCVLTMILLTSVVSGLGVNWGSIASHQIDPKIVVEMLKDNGINQVKLFNAEIEILSALQGTDMEVMIGASNQLLQSLAQDYSKAQEWVKENVTAYVSGTSTVNIK